MSSLETTILKIRKKKKNLNKRVPNSGTAIKGMQDSQRKIHFFSCEYIVRKVFLIQISIHMCR